ncbi:MAG TPA: AbrB/MazE/SpoVT family DNA-binding domain-containing protein [Verrucomicrobiae bacterium]|jgi:AbrB family looped-hinge helix DNA binding protein|nr:AbrB/MazE/SpoVT family DNA-binding domain-containing protein [Verrucomicrobiae bacterium]
MSDEVQTQPLIVGKRGTVVIPRALRRKFNLHDGSMLIAEGRKDGVLLRPQSTEIYTLEEKASFLLSNAVNERDYLRAKRDVRKLGLDPSEVPHLPPHSNSGRKAR